ncbi:MAG: DUF5394 family protein [Rickettsiaceae bacterium]|nr:DUF5394 family protein [Rickettsiaceae bacterium]
MRKGDTTNSLPASEDGNIMKKEFCDELDKLFEETDDLAEIQSRMMLFIMEYNKQEDAEEDISEEDKQNIIKAIKEKTKELIEKHEAELEEDINKTKDKSLYHVKSKARENLKRILKVMAIYEIYKVMNPERIAGESKKDNYVHNMMRGGTKLASKYTGGKESDLKNYSKGFIKDVAVQSKSFKKGGGSIGR